MTQNQTEAEFANTLHKMLFPDPDAEREETLIERLRDELNSTDHHTATAFDR